MHAPAPRAQRVGRAPLRAPRLGRGDLRLFGAVLVVALALALLGHAHHGRAIPGLVRGGAASLVLALVCGDALAAGLLPAAWRGLAPIFALALGMAASGLALTALGLAHLPLAVSLWVLLAAGLTASVLVRRRERRGERRREPGQAAAAPADAQQRGIARRLSSHPATIWIAVLAVVFCVAVIPAGRLAQDTVFGTNPDASQVVGIAVLFQHAPPTATDYSQPLNAVPPAWRFRYPIFYPLAAASNLAHFDPIAVFPALSALLVVIACFGYGLLAVELFDAPKRAGPAIAAAFGFSWVALHLAWHPYYKAVGLCAGALRAAVRLARDRSRRTARSAAVRLCAGVAVAGLPARAALSAGDPGGAGARALATPADARDLRRAQLCAGGGRALGARTRRRRRGAQARRGNLAGHHPQQPSVGGRRDELHALRALCRHRRRDPAGPGGRAGRRLGPGCA